MKRTVYVGTYLHTDLLMGEEGPPGRADGIYEMAFDEAEGTLSLVRAHHGILNPSFLTLSRDGKRLYCVHELSTYQGTEGGGVSGYRIDEDGEFALINSQPTHGDSPCHIVLSPNEGLVSVANYGGGSLSGFQVAADGSLGGAQVIQHYGSGPNKDRQEAPHVHASCFTPSGSDVIVMDLGTDTVTAYPVQNDQVIEKPASAVNVEPGDGPRMPVYDVTRNLLYVGCEMGSKVAAFACDAKGVPTKYLWAVSTLPDEGITGSTVADIRLSADGRFLYASNRGHDSIAVFSISEDGKLTPVEYKPCGGQTPRGFTLSPSGNWLLCGHQDSDTIAVFSVDKDKGTLMQQSLVDLPSPVCLVFAP